MRNPLTMAPYEDFETGLTPERVPELHTWVGKILRDESLTPDQRRATLALGAAKVLPHLPYSEAARRALSDGTICMLGEVPLPFWPRYTAPDYSRLLRQGSRFLGLRPATDLHEALTALLAAYQYSATVTMEPVWLGNLDELLEPYYDSVPEPEARRALRSFWTLASRLFPSSFVHADIGPRATRIGRLLLELDREAAEPVNTTFRYLPGVTPPEFALDAARTAMTLSKPYFHNHKLSAADWGEEYAVASCYNLMAIGGGVHTLVRLNLAKVAAGAASPAEMLESTLPAAAALLCEIIALRTQFLGAESRFFETSWWVQEGLLDVGRFTAYAGFFGLAEAVNSLMAAAGKPAARYGHDRSADRLAADIIARLAECVAAHPAPYCDATGGRASLHAQVGIDSDLGYTPAARIPAGEEPDLYDHFRAVSVHDRRLSGGVSNIFEFEPTAADNPQAVLDIVQGAFALGCRNLALGPSGGELVRVSGYLMRRSDMERRHEGVAMRGDGARLGTAFFDHHPQQLQRRVRSV